MSDDNDSAAPRTAFEHHITERVNSLEGSRRFWKWVVGLCAPILGSAVLALTLYSASAIQASSERTGETRAILDSLQRTINSLDSDIRELRARIMKLSIRDGGDVGITLASVP